MADLAVLGAGPAGCAAALHAASLGLSVTLVGPPPQATQRIGENLAASAKPLLQQLGLWPDFLAQGHLPCEGSKSAWGSSVLVSNGFIGNPYGHAWLLDRPAFDQLLYRRAARTCATLETRFRNALESSGGWALLLDNGMTLNARFVIDASGASSRFARSQGVSRMAEDHLLAGFAYFRRPSEWQDNTSLIEAVEDGWWYSAPIPGDRLVAMFLTQPSNWNASWDHQLKLAPHTKDRIDACHARVSAGRFIAASSGILDRATGAAWAAVGDAAMIYDPISAQGITAALAGGMDGAKSAHAWLNGDLDAPGVYENRIQSAWHSYQAARVTLYAQEKRWKSSRFWQLRGG